MSKVGKLRIRIPSGVTVTIQKQRIEVKWPKGTLSHEVPESVTLQQVDDEIDVSIQDETKKNFWWLTRTLIHNMCIGVTQGYEKKLLVLWVGFTVKTQGKELILQLGFSHPVHFAIPLGIEIQVDKDTKGNPVMSIQGSDKQLVGEVTAKIRDLKKPEPYKGKGIRYMGETVKMKAGKSAKK